MRWHHRAGALASALWLAYLMVYVAPTDQQVLQASSNLTANSNTRSQSATTDQQQDTPVKSQDCPRPCTNSEFATILNKISLNNVDILRDFPRNENQQHQRGSGAIRPECVKQLIQMIKNLASGELEMKTLLEFASSTTPINLRHDLSHLRASYANDKKQAPTATTPTQTLNPNGGCQSAGPSTNQMQPVEYLLGDEPAGGLAGSETDAKAHFLPKLVASVDQWLDTIERFTMTSEWSALMRVFNGLESILSMFPVPTSSSSTKASIGKLKSATSITPVFLTNQTNSTEQTELVAKLERELPRQVQTLTGSLHQLFPWHVWPWNNIDLYSTVDTFLNHGIFAFSKTTAGPERRIDYLPQMLENIFRSLKWDSFPKKCNDWSRIICDLELFYDKLALAPMQEVELSSSVSSEASNSTIAAEALAAKQRQALVDELTGSPKNKLTQELVCIMFSSLSMQQFGAKDVDFEGVEDPHMSNSASAQQVNANGPRARTQAPTTSSNNKLLEWDRQIRKGLRLYKLSREALTDEQWLSLYKQLDELWNQMKISDRVIMVGRIVQLLTNCHMPREILESALWKDIYKYKNALNQLGDIVIEELNRSAENGQFTLKQLAIGSSHLEDILTRFVKLLPRVLESASQTITGELPELVEKFFDEKIAFFKGPCKGHSLGELVPSLAKYRDEIVEFERLVCEQLSTKPSITMMQINNLTNEILAMALNFTNFGGSFQSLPLSFWSKNFQQQDQTGAAGKANAGSAATSSSAASPAPLVDSGAAAPASNGSIIDELAANPRLAQIVAILQSSALDPPEVHAELPELDWVEAGTSIALFYESIQKLMSFEGLFVVFPEVGNFQEEMRVRLETSKQMFQYFGKRDPIHLAAYSMDTLLPVALRTFQPLDSFHSECLSTFRDIFGETDFSGSSSSSMFVSRESRQWQCAISSTNFASYALNNLIKTFNSMLRNILAQMSRQRDMFKFKQQQVLTSSSKTLDGNSSQTNATTCVLFDGSVTTLMDNLPQLVDLGLETLLIASTNLNQRPTLKETLCSFENTLDPLADQQMLHRQLKLREAVCHLLHESSLASCSDALRVDQWTQTMKELNVTWFEMSPVSVDPSFRGILGGVHEFLDLFGKVKPSSMSDGLLARVLNFNSYWTGLMNKAVSSFEKYKERRFQVALQILMPIIYENLPVFQSQAIDEQRTKRDLKTWIMAAKSVLLYLNKPNSQQESPQQQQNASQADQTQPLASNTTNQQELIDNQLRELFELADRHSILASECLLRTIANNMTKFEYLLGVEGPTRNATLEGNSTSTPWTRFCSAPIDTYLQFDLRPIQDQTPNKASLPGQARLVEAQQARDSLCDFEWAKLEERLFLQNSPQNVALNNTQQQPLTPLDQYSTKQLVRVALTKWGQVFDLVATSATCSTTNNQSNQRLSRYPKFLTLAHWQQLQEKLPSISPSQYEPTNFVWVWQAIEQLIGKLDNSTSAAHQVQAPVVITTTEALMRIFDQLNCALDTVKGGMTWDNMVNIYQDRQDVLAAHSTLNNGIALASAGANTFLVHKKFQRFLNNFVKPRMGLAAFCEMRDKSRLEATFSLSPTPGQDQEIQEKDRDELVSALESFQEFICDTNIETLVLNINPISVCYPIAATNSSSSISSSLTQAKPQTGLTGQEFPLTGTIERFFKLVSLAVLDAKLVDTNDAKPPIFDKSQWDQLRLWWLNQTEVHQGNSGLALTLVRVFQTLDSINSEHVVWRAIFRSFHELSEVSAYLLRAAEMERQASAERSERGQPTKLALIREAAEQVESAFRSPTVGTNATDFPQAFSTRLGNSSRKQQQLASTMANVMFPEVSNFITLRTFKQLRYIKSISDYFASASGAQELICRNLTASNGTAAAGSPKWGQSSQPANKFELIDYKLNSSKSLYALLCHYHSNQWLTAMNIVLSSKTSSLTKKVNYMTKYFSLFTKNFEHNEHLQSFIHGQQLENIEAVANKTVSYMIALSQPFRTLTLSKISNISWHSIPSLLDSIDRHLCASKYEGQLITSQPQHNSSASPSSTQQQPQQYQLAVYEPKKPDIEVIICKLPSWNMTQVYNYFSENIDLQNMISLATQNNHTARLLGIVTGSAPVATATSLVAGSAANSTTAKSSIETATKQSLPTCITPFKFGSKWLKIAQDLIDESMSKASKDKIRKCLSANKKNQSAYLQTMRYIKLLNSLLATLNDLTRQNSWPLVRKTWASISYAILNESGSTALPATAGQIVAGQQLTQANQAALPVTIRQ